MAPALHAEPFPKQAFGTAPIGAGAEAPAEPCQRGSQSHTHVQFSVSVATLEDCWALEVREQPNNSDLGDELVVCPSPSGVTGQVASSYQ